MREEREPYNRTILELQMLDLFPPGILDILQTHYGERFEALSQTARLALATTLSEGRLTHARLVELTNQHPADLTKKLSELISDGFLTSEGSGRGAVYRFAGTPIVGPDDVLRPDGSPDSGHSSPDLEPSSTGLASSSTGLDRNEDGLLISQHHQLCFVDQLDQLSPAKLEELEALAALPRAKKRISREEMIETLLKICSGHFITLDALGRLVTRNPHGLRESYLTPLRKEHRIQLAFPDTPNDERQAYTSVA